MPSLSPSPLSLFSSLPPFASPLLHHACPIPFSPPPRRRDLAFVSTSRRRTVACCAPMSVQAPDPPSPLRPLPKDVFKYCRAYWVARSLIAWNHHDEDATTYLYASKVAGLCVTDDGIEGYDVKIHLEHDKCGLPANVMEKFPHISSYTAFKLPESAEVVNLLKCQLAIGCFQDGKCKKATGLQLPGVLDDLFSYNGPLGALFTEEVISLYLWAPTAQAVSAYIYKGSSVVNAVEYIQLEEVNGVWNVNVPRSWEGFYYVYEVSAYHPSTLQIETCRVNDPYARGLSPDGKRTLLVNLENDDLKPPGWDELADEKPILSCFSDISIYELHIRDFSVRDFTVDHEKRGCCLAFTCENSDGTRHLKRLAKAGLTHVHLLPSFHFGGVDDEKEKWTAIDHVRLASYPPDSDQQQAEVVAVQENDGYNWGYNPILWGVPKGSYASNPNGPIRTLEYRRMVQALNRMGLRVVLDVVYNHVHESGHLIDDSVLEKIVPGYYLRRNTDGFIEHSTCTNNTATEHFMTERLVIDDLLCWAVHYKVDGFRFDLMGHIMRSTMVKAKSTLHKLSKSNAGVDGSQIYIYGEGWDFGEVANNGRGVNASQLNIPGTGIGSFNDRIRDAVLGGSPFGHPLQQGFVTGISLQTNGHDHGDENVVESILAASTDHIQIGLAANLRDFVFTGNKGEAVKGSEVLTHGGIPVAYASSPIETVNYVSAHDNETLFDIIAMKAPVGISIEERCRMNHLATSIVAFSQGIPFFHCGDEILRSKSLDRDSYNSGDWFNRLDFTYESNNWGVGLPPKEKNEKSWPLIKTRLADPSYKPSKSHILSALQNYEELLRIRYSSPLFRLKTANSIQERVRFHNCGPNWIPGVIAMSIEDGYEGIPGMAQLDPNYSYIVVIFNARPTEATVTIPLLRERTFQLHPIQLTSAEKLVHDSAFLVSSGSFKVPHRTTSVFVEVRRS